MFTVLTAISPALALPFILILNAAAFLRIRLLGYLPITAALLVAGVDAVPLLAVIGIDVLLPDNYWEVWGVAIVCIFLIGTVTFVALGCAVLVRKLPKRGSTRVFGRRRVRFPLVSLGYLTIIGGIIAALTLFYFLPPWDLEDFFLVSMMALLVIGFFSYIGLVILTVGERVRNQPTIEDASKADARLPVLYLRPFAWEGFPFIFTREKFGRGVNYIPHTFERYLGAAIREQIGPFVALGRPEDWLPSLGADAVRTYANDEGWYEDFERLARQAACMVMLVSDSNNLKRELTFIRGAGLQRRLFIFTHPMKAKPGAVQFVWLLNWILLRLFGPPPGDTGGGATWEQFAENLGKLGFQLGNDPGHGAVVTFDSEGNAVVLVRGEEGLSNYADDWPPLRFVVPIRAYLVRALGVDLSKGAVKAESHQPAALPSENGVPTPG